MKLTVYLYFLFLFFLSSIRSFSQINDYRVGDYVSETIEVYNTDDAVVNLKFPTENYILVYKYKWIEEGSGVDNQDSIKLLESKIAEMLVGGMIGNLKVICLSYNRGANYNAWIQKIKQSKPFKTTSKYKVEYYNMNISMSEQKSKHLFSKLSLFGPDGRLLRWSSGIGSFYYHSHEANIKVKAKLLTDIAGVKEPLNEAFVHVHSGTNGDTLAMATTDKYGDFEVMIPNNQKNYVIKARPKDKNTKNVLLVTQEGVVISKFDKQSLEFEYKLLKTDIIELSDLKIIDDISLAYKKMSTSKDPAIVIENIIYGLLKYNIEKESLPTLNKVSTILKDNPNTTLEVVSHTDAQGDDNFNLTLSEKRAAAVVDYLIQNGIDASRLKAFGKGETEIRNRCGNNVSCSDIEHRYNRRTEFKFFK